MLAVSMAIPEVTTLDQWGREPFKHPVLEGLAGLTRQKKDGMLDKRRMAQLARKYGLVGVLRWKPKEVSFAIRL